MVKELKGFVNFGGPDWNAIKMYLEHHKEVKIGSLISATDEKKADRLRGAIEFINQILNEAAAAQRPQH